MIKGLEAIVVESFTTARRYGVEDHVLASLHETFPTLDWEKQGAYLFSRVALHGKRRAEEMREVAVTVREAGLEPHMAAATAERQDWVAGLKSAAGLGGRGEGRGLARVRGPSAPVPRSRAAGRVSRLAAGIPRHYIRNTPLPAVCRSNF